MTRPGFGPARLAALAPGALVPAGGPAPAQVVDERADATAGAAQATCSVPGGGARPVRISLHEPTSQGTGATFRPTTPRPRS